MKIHSNCTFGSDDRARLKSKFLKQKYDRLCVPDNPVWIQTLFLTKKKSNNEEDDGDDNI